MSLTRRLPVGAEVVGDATHVRVWAPAVTSLDMVLVSELEDPGHHVSRCFRLQREADGHFSGLAPGVGDGDLYLLRLDGERLRPDPGSRFQPAGPHGPSMVVESSRYRWRCSSWPAPTSRPDVVYEMHVGTFSPEGTWRGALPHLRRLADLGITVLEVMPVAEFTGTFGWGYDGVCPFAPYHHYGTPDDMRTFVDEAHRLKLAVILDVVYNHCGPDGCHLREFSPEYFSTTHQGEWGAPFNFDGPGHEGPREMVVANASYWIAEFNLDGLRLDATQAIFDDSERHVIAELIAGARAVTSRRLWFVAENEPQRAQIVRPTTIGGFGGDALWNDDFHHVARVAATGRRDAYFSDYEGAPQEFVSAAKYGYLYQGQYYAWQRQPRGALALDLPSHAFVCFLENHDQVANSLRGARLRQLSSPARYRALSALLLLGPWVPMLFQGQEWGSEQPFLYFADLPEGLRADVARGRAAFLAQFPGCADHASGPADPADVETFRRSRLESPRNGPITQLYADLIRLRREDPTLADPERVDGAVLGEHAFALRVFGIEPELDRLLVVNLARTIRRTAVAEPLLAPPTGRTWQVAWDSERPAYGGSGLGDADLAAGLAISGECAVLFAATAPPFVAD